MSYRPCVDAIRSARQYFCAAKSENASRKH